MNTLLARLRFRRSAIVIGVAVIFASTVNLRADDWPQFRGPNRDAVWNEAGILQTFPPGGLTIRWRAPIGSGLCSPVVAQGRVYLIDSELIKPKAHERVGCWDEKTGQRLWNYSYEASYPAWAFDKGMETGPNATPIVEAGKVFTLGGAGQLLCLDALQGAVVWEKNLAKDYDLNLEEYPNLTPSPLIEGDLLIVVIRGRSSTCVAAFDKTSGKEVWKALSERFTYSSPIVISAGGKRQLIVWTPKAVTSLDPATGETWWREELATANGYGVATPVHRGDLLLFSGLMLQLDSAKPAASILWPEMKPMSKRILSDTSTPLILGDHVYSGDRSGHLICLEARTGKQVWQTDKVTGRGNGATLHLTPNGDSILIFSDEGNLIRARLTSQGFDELSRVHVIDPTYSFAGRNVIWAPPAYANAHMFVRNDNELLCASLAANAGKLKE
jgi:outer membrane protein assembly factor BamB